jgi:hypothetical protein
MCVLSSRLDNTHGGLADGRRETVAERRGRCWPAVVVVLLIERLKMTPL